MATTHGKGAEVEINSVDLSAFCNSIEYKTAADSHDSTTFGQDGHTYAGGLTDGTISLKGVYDDGAASTPKVTLPALLGTVTTFAYRPEGTATGKPETTGSCLVIAYEETAPVADLIAWAAEFQISGSPATADQS